MQNTNAPLPASCLVPSRPVSFVDVKIEDAFWSPRLHINRNVSLFFQYEQLKRTGRIDALRLLWRPGSDIPKPSQYWDSDTAKWVEAASYVMATDPDPKLGVLLDEVVGLFEQAQQPDGYLNSYFCVVEPERRWTNLHLDHELYCAGHIFEAAVAHFESTGSRKLLDVAIRFADHIASVFGREEGKLQGYCGHEEIELALVRLYRTSGLERILALASYFVEERGVDPKYFDLERRRYAALAGHEYRFWGHEYCQSHLPVREQSEPVGHAVRALYLYSGMAELALAQHDRTLFDACSRLWERIAQTQLYVTGQVGALWHNEAFSTSYDLPDEKGYCETCAGVALIQWNHRMLQLDCDSRYADQLEQSLYNGALSGMGIDGRSFFYQNPLADRGQHRRSEWFECSCCPSNLSRLLASLGGYVASVTAGGVAVHLYCGSNADILLPSGNKLHLTQRTNYPWQGHVRLELKPAVAERFELSLRVPSWSSAFVLRVDGEVIHPQMRKGYALVTRTWSGNETVEIEFAMVSEQLVAHPAVLMNRSQVALRRGPVVYCLESADNDFDVFDLSLAPDARLKAVFEPDLLGGVTVLEGEGTLGVAADWDGRLYATRSGLSTRRPVHFRAVPYYAWANRKPGQMSVWLRASV